MAKTLFEWKEKKKNLDAQEGKWLFKDMPIGPLSLTGTQVHTRQGKTSLVRPGTEGRYLGPGD